MRLLTSFQNARYMQYMAAITVTLSVANSAMYTTWSSPSLPKLTSPDSPIGVQLTKEEASWVASLSLLGLVPGSFLLTLFLEKLGRKTVLLLFAIPVFVPWIVCAFANSVWLLMVARLIAGIGGTAANTVVPMYVGEIAEKDIRGKLGSAFNMLKLTGSLFVLCVGPFVSYTALTLSCAAFPLIFVTLFVFMPESPYFLITRNNRVEAERNLIRLSRRNCDSKTIYKHLEEIEETVEYDMKNKSTLWEFLTKQEHRRGLIVMFGVKTLQQFSGMNAIDAYIQTIIESSTSSITPEVSSIICGVVQIPAVLLAASLVDKMGRKPLLIISSLGCAIALIAEGAYFYLQDVVHADLSSFSWLPTAALIFYLIMNPIGVFTLPYVLMGELFATNIKGVAVSTASCYGGGLAFLVVKFFEPISSAWGMYTMFWIFGGSCILGALFAFFVLPETKGKTFAEIQAKMNRKNKTHWNNTT